MKGNIAGLMQQAQKMQQEMQQAQEELARMEVTGQSGGGLVEVVPHRHPAASRHVWPMQVIRDGRGEVSGIDVRDVVDVPAGGAVTVRIAFDRLPARTVYHCHILDHEDLGMMGVVEVA